MVRALNLTIINSKVTFAVLLSIKLRCVVINESSLHLTAGTENNALGCKIHCRKILDIFDIEIISGVILPEYLPANKKYT